MSDCTVKKWNTRTNNDEDFAVEEAAADVEPEADVVADAAAAEAADDKVEKVLQTACATAVNDAMNRWASENSLAGASGSHSGTIVPSRMPGAIVPSSGSGAVGPSQAGQHELHVVEV